MNFIRPYRVTLWLLFIPLFILIVLRGIGFDGMAGQDSYAYVDHAKSLQQQFTGLSNHSEYFPWGKGYSLLGALLSLGWSIALTLQLISCLSLSISLIFVFRILKKIYPSTDDQPILIYLLLFGTLSPYYIRNGLLTMSDMLACCLIITTVYYGFLYVQHHFFKYFIICITIIPFAAFVRYPSIVVTLPVIGYIVFHWFKSIKKWSHLVALFIPFVFLSLHVFLSKDLALFGFISNGPLNYWNINNYFHSSFQTTQGNFSYFLPNVAFVFYPFAHYGFLLLGIPFLWLFIKKDKIKHPLLTLSIASYLIYAFFIAGFDAQNPRYLLLTFPFVLVICFYGFNYCYQLSIFRRIKKIMIGLGLLFQLVLCSLAFKTIFLRNDLEQIISQDLTTYKNQTLYSFGIDVALKSRATAISHISLFDKKHTSFENGGLVLFNEKRFSNQWKGENPMINWNHLKEKYTLTELEEYSNNWKLYRIE